MRIMLWIGGPIILALVAVLALVFWRMQPTTGPRIETYPSPRTALLIIDIQEDYTGPHAQKPYRDSDRLVEIANALLAQAQEKGILVVYIQNVVDNPLMAFFMGGINAPYAPGTEMDRRLLLVPGGMTFAKNRSDAFSTPELESYLRANQVNRLLLTGLDGAYCVNATTRGALNRGYQVTLFVDGIATESGKPIEKLALEWQKAGAQVKSGSEI
ncbi:MAG: cysteine hydrolase family protein [Desulfobulbaceae bacterium]